MNTNLFRWSLAFVTTGIFSIFAVAQLGGPNVCAKGRETAAPQFHRIFRLQTGVIRRLVHCHRVLRSRTVN